MTAPGSLGLFVRGPGQWRDEPDVADRVFLQRGLRRQHRTTPGGVMLRECESRLVRSHREDSNATSSTPTKGPHVDGATSDATAATLLDSQEEKHISTFASCRPLPRGQRCCSGIDIT